MTQHRHRRHLLVLTAAIATMVLCLPLLVAAGQGAAVPAGTGLPGRALQAYVAVDQWCPGLRWELVAAIGEVESGHGTAGGAALDPVSGVAAPWIFGPPLDGTDGTQRLPAGRWAGRWGLEGPWERAIGPMQFRAPTFAAWAVDGDGDGTADPHDIDDAAATVARYLCGAERVIGDERAALLRYNRSSAYVAQVLAVVDRLTARAGAGWWCPVVGVVSFTDTWGAPRSGGRVHRGVDMFAPYGTPVVAPIAGTVAYRYNTVGGRSFHLYGTDGTYVYGTHLSAYGPEAGSVIAGTVVGFVGTTGNAAATPPHLHLEIHPGRRPGDPPNPVNPTATVAAACASR